MSGIALSAMLLAMPPISTVTADSIGRPERGDVAVIDCSQKASYLNYSDDKTVPYDWFDRVVFHVKDWDGKQPVLGYGVQKSGEVFDNSYYSMGVTGDGPTLSLLLSYPPMGSLSLEFPAKLQGTGSISGREQMRHGDGEIQMTGACQSKIIRMPATKKSAS